ncbi:MAG: hypothetical protein ACYTEQ_05495 [Planctomycetota bacterium]|jgi:hypothetical protein
MTKVLFSITWEQGEPTVNEICKLYGFQSDEIDVQFGVIEVDPQDRLFTILVDSNAAERVRGGRETQLPEGPYANPPIHPFGPPVESENDQG